MKITSSHFEAFLKCPTQCWLRFTGEPPSGNLYAEWVQAETESYRAAAAKRLTARPADEGSSPGSSRREEAHYSAEALKTAQWQFAVDIPASTELRSRRDNEAQTEKPGIANGKSEISQSLHAVERIPSAGRGQSAQFVPIRFIHRNKLTKDDKLLLAFDAFVLSEMLGRAVSIGKIIHGDIRNCARSSRGDEAQTEKSEINQSLLTSAATHNQVDEPQSGISAALNQAQPRVTKVKTSALAGEVRKRLGKITALLASPTPPDLVLNRHCAECEFQARCRKLAVEKDDLSLLANLSAKERQKLRSKGIFTVTQLSYTFRPRRRPRRQRDKREKYHHALKALAIREQKIHIVGSPELKLEGTPVYLDVEGLPDRDFYYLIGLRIGHGDSAVQHSLWADTVADEGKIWREFLALLETVEEPVLIHYGSYETTFLNRMSESYGGAMDGSSVAKVIELAVNAISVLFAQIYFPTFANGLKDIAGYLGFKWSEAEPAGMKTILWRCAWEKNQTLHLREKLVTYNLEDCHALEVLVRTTLKLSLPQPADKPTASLVSNVVHTESIPQQSMWGKFLTPISDFEQINKAARWDYQRERIYVRNDEKIRQAHRRRKKSQVVTGRVNKVIAPPNISVCPKCHRRTRLRKNPPSTLHDIKFTRFSIRRWIVTYQYYSACCPQCHFYSGRPSEFRLHSQYGRNVVSFVVFQVIGLCIPQQTVAEFLNRVLGMRIPECTVNGFKASSARYYEETRQKIMAKMVKGNLIHVDETRIMLKGKPAYVWVFATFREVVYLYSETREGDLLERKIKEFKGILVSDFYAVYDSVPCRQQKCLIHLMRDLNDTVLDHPFDEEVRGIVTKFGEILRSVVATIDRWGLKSHFLRKHGRQVERFYRDMSHKAYQSEAALKCKERFEKNREKLFTFLNHDGVPWNNNNAEHAIKAFARLRRAIEGLSTPKGIEEYLILLSVCQTCKYMGVDFLDFLRSGEQDIYAFAESRRRRKRPSPTRPSPSPDS